MTFFQDLGLLLLLQSAKNTTGGNFLLLSFSVLYLPQIHITEFIYPVNQTLKPLRTWKARTCKTFSYLEQNLLVCTLRICMSDLFITVKYKVFWYINNLVMKKCVIWKRCIPACAGFSDLKLKVSANFLTKIFNTATISWKHHKPFNWFWKFTFKRCACVGGRGRKE